MTDSHCIGTPWLPADDNLFTLQVAQMRNREETRGLDDLGDARKPPHGTQSCDARTPYQGRPTATN